MYTETSIFSFFIEVINLYNEDLIHYQINAREVINFYIAEGLYKFMANYMSSRMSYNDIKVVSRYILNKIQQSNFLDMMEIKMQRKVF